MMKLKLRSGERTDLEDAQNGICENCERETKVRRVEAYSMFAMASRESSRGFYNLCYKCFGPRIIWSKGGKEYRSPISVPYNELDEFLRKHFQEKSNNG